MNNYSSRSPPAAVGVVGAGGYAGRELLRLLARHPGARVVAATGVEAEMRAAAPEYVFLATPAEVSIQWVAGLGTEGDGPQPRIIDLSGAFRLNHAGAAVYGWPEKNREAIRTAALVANPGCYATAALTALWPLVAAGAIEPAEVICDAKSGASGAGKGLRDDLHFCELEANCKAYSIYTHRHAPEIAAHAGLDPASFAFTPHLLPTSRGILATSYVKLRTADLGGVYERAYAEHPFVRLRTNRLPELNDVARTNFCDLGWAVRADGRQAVIVSCLDNLVKGAAGQAVQNFNLMAGWPEETALL
ncbi:MAG: N-acetyl-gamma-glutamyl-phosphate reductase [Terriglobales bacterium]